MWAAVPDIALARAGYALTMRRGLPEAGANNQLIMAGHEAMLAQESATAEPNSVLQVVLPGYEINGRLLRPARVIVSKASG